MNFLLKNIKRTFNSIKKHKLLFIFLIILQICLILTLSYTFLLHQVKIMENAQDVLQPLDEANYDPQKIETGQPFLKDALTIYNSYQEIEKSVYSFFFYFFLIFLTLNGLLWLGAHYIIKKRSLKTIARQYQRYFLSVIVLFALLFSLIYLTINYFFSQIELIFLSMALFLITYYFILIAFTLLSSKKWLKAIFIVSLKKIRKTLLVLFINLALIAFSFSLIYLTLESTLVLLASFIFIVVLLLTKILLIVSLEEIVYEKNNY